MRPIAVSGVETERAGLIKLGVWGAVALVTLYIFIATIEGPKRSS